MLKKLLPVLFLFSLFAHAQGLLLPNIGQQFFDENGMALSGGKLYACAALGACPGTPQATYNSSSLTTQNQNPFTLDASGRAPTGIWLTPGLSYTFVTTTSGGAVVSTMTNVMGGITVPGSTLAPCGTGGGAGSPSQIQYYSTPTSLGCSSNLTWSPTAQVLGVTGLTGQAALGVYSGYIQTFGGVLSTVPGGSWNAFNSPSDGALLRGYTLQQTTTNNAGGYIDIAPIGYNPYNGALCIDSFGNVVQQPLPLNGSSGFGANDSVLWVGTSPSMPSGGSCGAPLPVSPSQTYKGVANQSFGLFVNSYFFARGGVATDNNAFNSLQALNGGAYLKLGVTTDQAVYPKAYASSSSLNNPGTGYGGLAYQGGNVYYFFNSTTGTWNTVNLASGGGGGGSAQGPANAIQANDATGAGMFTGYAWLLAIPGSQSLSALGGFTTTSGAGACTAFNCIQAPVGGLYAGLGVTADQAFYPKAFATTSGLNTPASGYGGLTYAGSSVGTGATYRYYNAMAAAWATVDFSASGSGCTLGGTATGQVLFNLSSACASSANMAWNNASQLLSLTGTTSTAVALSITGTAQASNGFNSVGCTNVDCIQAPNGGLKSGLGVTANQAFYPFGYSSSLSLNAPAFGYGGIGYTGTGLNYWIWNASSSAWTSVNLGAGGGGGACPGGGTNTIQFNNGTTNCAGSGNLTFDGGTNVLNLNGTLTVLGGNSINTSNQFVGTGGVNTTGSGTFASLNTTGTGAITAGGTVTSFGTFNRGATVVIDGSTNFVGNAVKPTITGSGIAFQTASGLSIEGNGSILMNSGAGFSLAGGTFIVITNSAFPSIVENGGTGGTQLYTGNSGLLSVPLLTSSTTIPFGCGSSPYNLGPTYLSVSSDGFLEVCANGVRSRVALTVY